MEEKGKRKEVPTQKQRATARKRRKVTTPKKCLKESHPDVYAEIHPTKNVGIATDALTKGSAVKIWWKCSKHRTCTKHEWETTVNARTNSKNGCPFCYGRSKRCECPTTIQPPAQKRLFKDECPNLVCEIDLTLNPGVDLSLLTWKSDRFIIWTCSQHTTCDAHRWESRVGTRSQHGCPFCSGHRTCECQTFVRLFPDLTKEVDLDRHPGLDLKMVGRGSQLILHWKCANPEVKCDHHRWQASICNRVKGSGCPFCSEPRKQTCVCESFVTIFPELGKQVDHSACQHDVSAISCGSHEIISWKCTNPEVKCDHHKWLASVHQRVMQNQLQGCPFCSRHRACPCNSIKITFPEVLTELDREKCSQIDLDWMSAFSRKKLPWKCKTCGHAWQARVYNRTGGGCGCPVCHPSRLGLECKKSLESLGITFAREKRFDDCRCKKPLPFDVWLLKLKALIELDGEQHFVAVNFGGGVKSDLPLQQERDRIKTNFTRTKGIHFCRISHSEISNMENHLRSFVQMIEASTSRVECFYGIEYLAQ